mgnify:CR=1 FL=1
MTAGWEPAAFLTSTFGAASSADAHPVVNPAKPAARTSTDVRKTMPSGYGEERV